MIKFFRKIRQKLLTENKFSKYLLYAIGEIILVMIGILLALQVNNWNESKKDKKQEKIYLNNLQDDLKGIIVAYKVAMDFEKLILKQSNDIIKHYEANDGFYNMDTIFPKLNDLSFRWGTTANSTTLTEMINSGQTKLISNTSLRKELIEFNEELKLWTTNTLNNNTNLVDNLIVPEVMKSGTYSLYGLSEPMKTLLAKTIILTLVNVNDVTLATLSQESLNNSEQKLKMINLINFRHSIASLQKTINSAITQHVEQLIATIETELKK
jgi:hypothetical protein